MSNNKNGKVKVVAPESIIKVTAKDKDGNILGTGKAYAYSENAIGLDAAVKRVKHKEIVKLINRQLKTDKRNELARPEGDMLKTKCKVMLSMIETNKSLKDIFIKEVNTWVHLSSDVRNELVEILKAA